MKSAYYSLIVFFLGLASFVSLNAQDDLYYTPDYTDEYVASDGDTYITNNYYGDSSDDEDYVFYDDDEYDYYYSSRIKRFRRPYQGFGYFSDIYVNRYFYNYDPFFWGSSIYATPSWARRYRTFRPGWSFSYNSGWGGNSYFGSPWASSYYYNPYGPQLGGFGSPYAYNSPFYSPYYSPYYFGDPNYYYGNGFGGTAYNPCYTPYSATGGSDANGAGFVGNSYTYGPRVPRGEVSENAGTGRPGTVASGVPGGVNNEGTGKVEPVANGNSNVVTRPGTSSAVNGVKDRPAETVPAAKPAVSNSRPSNGSFEKPGNTYERPSNAKVDTDSYDFYRPTSTPTNARPNTSPSSRPANTNRPASGASERPGVQQRDVVRQNAKEQDRQREERLLNIMRDWQEKQDRNTNRPSNTRTQPRSQKSESNSPVRSSNSRNSSGSNSSKKSKSNRSKSTNYNWNPYKESGRSSGSSTSPSRSSNPGSSRSSSPSPSRGSSSGSSRGPR